MKKKNCEEQLEATKLAGEEKDDSGGGDDK